MNSVRSMLESEGFTTNNIGSDHLHWSTLFSDDDHMLKLGKQRQITPIFG